MEYFIFILDALALIVLAIAGFVSEEDRGTVKFIVAVIIGISLFYNVNFICACGRSFLGKCAAIKRSFSKKSTGTEMKTTKKLTPRQIQLMKRQSPFARKGVDYDQ